MDDKYHMLIVGSAGGGAALSKAVKRANEKQLTGRKLIYFLIEATLQGIVVTWGVLGVFRHYVPWINSDDIKTLLAVVIGLLAGSILNAIEFSLAKLIEETIKRLPMIIDSILIEFVSYIKDKFKSKNKTIKK